MSLGPPKKRVHAVSRSHFLILSLTHSLSARLLALSLLFSTILLSLSRSCWLFFGAKRDQQSVCGCVCGWSGAGLGAERPRETVNTVLNKYIH